MKKRIILIALFFCAKGFAYSYEFQNSTPFTVQLKVSFEKGCKETSFDIEPSKIHTLKDQSCDIKTVSGTVYMEGKQSESGIIVANAYNAREAKKRDGIWAIYGPLYNNEPIDTRDESQQGMVSLKTRTDNKVIEAKTASFTIARLIE
jgi:hypothetical protein